MTSKVQLAQILKRNGFPNSDKMYPKGFVTICRDSVYYPYEEHFWNRMNRGTTFENESTKAKPTGKYIFGTLGSLPQYDKETQCEPNN